MVVALFLAAVPPPPPPPSLNFSPPELDGQCRVLLPEGRTVEMALHVEGRATARSIRVTTRAEDLSDLNGTHISGPTVVVGSGPDQIAATDTARIGGTGPADSRWLRLQYGRRLEDGGHLEITGSTWRYERPRGLGFCALRQISAEPAR